MKCITLYPVCAPCPVLAIKFAWVLASIQATSHLTLDRYLVLKFRLIQPSTERGPDGSIPSAAYDPYLYIRGVVFDQGPNLSQLRGLRIAQIIVCHPQTAAEACFPASNDRPSRLEIRSPSRLCGVVRPSAERGPDGGSALERRRGVAALRAAVQRGIGADGGRGRVGVLAEGDGNVRQILLGLRMSESALINHKS
jgi:hypothetical protein